MTDSDCDTSAKTQTKEKMIRVHEEIFSVYMNCYKMYSQKNLFSRSEFRVLLDGKLKTAFSVMELAGRNQQRRLLYINDELEEIPKSMPRGFKYPGFKPKKYT